MTHEIVYDGLGGGHNGEYTHYCKKCGKSDWIAGCGNITQLDFYNSPCEGIIEKSQKIDDTVRYVARRKATYISRLRTQVSGRVPTEEEFNAEYDAACDKNVQGYITNHRGVWVKDDRMVLN